VRKWATEFPEFAALFRLALEHQAHALAEQCISIADLAREGGAQVARLRFEARRWFVSKSSPRTYGATPEDGEILPGAGTLRVIVEVQGGKDEAQGGVTVEVVKPEEGPR
jgi:hypothetical protein